jgi:hypothetical protein
LLEAMTSLVAFVRSSMLAGTSKPNIRAEFTRRSL